MFVSSDVFLSDETCVIINDLTLQCVKIVPILKSELVELR